MKAGFVVAAAAALAGSASAAHRHAHGHHEQLFANKRGTEMCVPSCTTIYTTIYGEATLLPPKTTPKPTSTSSTPVVVPTPIAQTCPTPGVYTFPATTVTLTETTTVCAATSTTLPSGTHTYGGVTTVVETATTVVCPYATVSTKPGGVLTSVIATTTYVCPSAGTYTIAPTTTTVTVEQTLVVYPVVTTYCPGTYTAPALVTTVTETATVVYCPFEAPATTTATPPPAPKPTKEAPPPSKGLTGSGDHWAITYTPYASDSSGSCKSAEEVMNDIKAIKDKGFTTVRVYSTDCSTLEHVGAACDAYGIKMIIGVFIREPGCDATIGYIAEQITKITTWARWDLVELIVVGNECLHNGLCSPASLKKLIIDVKTACGAKGYTGPFTTAETVDVWQKEDTKSAICEVIDMVGGQIHPYFNAQTTPDQAGHFVKGQIDILEASDICGSKPAINLECGWPSAGSCNGVACPGPDNQAIAISSIKEVIGYKVVFFSYTNDEWKAPGACGCEQSWGCGSQF